jgi:peptidyl-prolyl cis-trans isomerase SurA
VNILQEDILRFYREHLEELRQPRQLHLSIVFLKAEGRSEAEQEKAVAKVQEQLKKGMPFSEAAKQYSDDVSAERAGDVGWVDVTSGKKEFVTAANGLKPGDISEPLHLPEGVYFLKLHEVKEERLPALDQALREKITAQLQQQKQKQRYDKYINQLREKYYVKTFF